MDPCNWRRHVPWQETKAFTSQELANVADGTDVA